MFPLVPCVTEIYQSCFLSWQRIAERATRASSWKCCHFAKGTHFSVFAPQPLPWGINKLCDSTAKFHTPRVGSRVLHSAASATFNCKTKKEERLFPKSPGISAAAQSASSDQPQCWKKTLSQVFHLQDEAITIKFYSKAFAFSQIYLQLQWKPSTFFFFLA